MKKPQGGIEKTPKSNTTSNNTTRKTTTISSMPKITPEMEKVIRAWDETFGVVVDKSDKELVIAISSAVQQFGVADLLQAINYRSQAKVYKETYPYLRDLPKSFFCHPKTIKNDKGRLPFKLITYDKMIELQQRGTTKRFEMDPEQKDSKGRAMWRMYD